MATFVPLGLSLVASTNPSSWSIIGIGTFWAFAAVMGLSMASIFIGPLPMGWSMGQWLSLAMALAFELMTLAAIRVLSQNAKGYVLVIEGGRIDRTVLGPGGEEP